MNMPFNREVLSALRAARPEPPSELISADGERAQRLLRNVLAERRPRRSRATRGRPRLVMAASAAAAAAAIGVLIALPDTDQQPASGSGTPPLTQPTDASMVVAPTIDPDGPRTARATLNVNGWIEQLIMEGEDVSTQFWIPPSADGPGRPVENRRVDGVAYFNFANTGWTYDSNDYTTLSAHPNGSTPYELYDTLSESTDFEKVESDEIDGVPVTHVRAADPSAVDDQLLPLGGSVGEVQSLDLWITEDGIVLRMEVTIVNDFDGPVEFAATTLGPVLETAPDMAAENFPTTAPQPTAVIEASARPPETEVVAEEQVMISIEFHDVGDPDIVLEAPEGAEELDAVG